jgi:hypothetical protein
MSVVLNVSLRGEEPTNIKARAFDTPPETSKHSGKTTKLEAETPQAGEKSPPLDEEVNKLTAQVHKLRGK